MDLGVPDHWGAIQSATLPLSHSVSGVTETNAIAKLYQNNYNIKPGTTPNKSTWLNAFYDPVAGLSTYSSCVLTCNLSGDGDWRLVVADQDRKLKVWKGAQKMSEHSLLDTPVAIASYIAEASPTRVVSLAVAAGSHIYTYRNLRPYYKFVIPQESVNDEEQTLWEQLMTGSVPLGEALAGLSHLQGAGASLTTRSLQLLNIGDPEAKTSFVEYWQGQPLSAPTTVTCLAVLKHAIDEPQAVSCLVAGTESGRVLIMNPAGTAIVRNVWIGVTPTCLSVVGEFEVSYRICVAGRDGKLYHLVNGDLSPTVTQLEAHPIGVVASLKAVVAGCMNETLCSYSYAAVKQWALKMPAAIVAVQRMEAPAARAPRAVVVALANGDIRVYSENVLLSSHSIQGITTALYFGRFGREDHTLITVTRTGALDIKILPRSANLEHASGGGGGASAPPPEQNIPLAVPKKTRLYVEQTQREKEHAMEMHRTFQKDLARFRLAAARAYAKVLTDGQGAAASTAAAPTQVMPYSASISINLSVKGLGPMFALEISCRNDGEKQLVNVPVLLLYDTALYDVLPPTCATLNNDEMAKIPPVGVGKSWVIPFLVPGVQYTFEVSVRCLDPGVPSDVITVMLLQPKAASAAAAAAVAAAAVAAAAAMVAREGGGERGRGRDSRGGRMGEGRGNSSFGGGGERGGEKGGEGGEGGEGGKEELKWGIGSFAAPPMLQAQITMPMCEPEED